VVPESQLAAQRKAGYFLDLWHWRAHRSNPIDKSDDQVVAEGRFGDKGKSVFFNNWDAEKKQPRFMFDPDKTGGRVALKWDDLINRKLGFEDLYYMREDQTKPYDASHPWKEGDVLPRHVLRPGDGSHADISVAGKARWKDGYWEVTLVRAMDTKQPEDDKIFLDHRVYTVAFAVHRDSLGSRWHYVSLPVRLGLNRQADTSRRRGSRAPSRNGISPGLTSSCSIPDRSAGRCSTARNMREPTRSSKAYRSNSATARSNLRIMAWKWNSTTR